MPIVQTSTLTGAALDYAVAQALKLPLIEEHGYVVWEDEPPQWFIDLLDLEMDGGRYDTPNWAPSHDVALAMPLLWHYKVATFAAGDNWCAASPGRAYNPAIGNIDTSWEDCSHGETPLIAGCRALVALLLGQTVNIPAALLKS